MNINNKTMKELKLTQQEINQVKELIYNKIDQVDGYENLEESLKTLLKKLRS
jgi:hypothetical protein